MKFQRNIKLAKYTTFHLGGPAKFFVEVNNSEELKEAAEFSKKNRLKTFILGGGSNLLLSDKGINGLVIKIDIRGMRFDGNLVYAGAGEIWDEVVSKSVNKNLSGIENLSLIPGTVGGAVYQNIGAYGAELKDTLESVDIFDIKNGTVKTLSNKECKFGYRTSFFQGQGSGYIILGALLRLNPEFNPNLSYPGLESYFVDNKPTLKEVRRAVIKIRRAKLVYPTDNIGTAGSFFKNPTITVADFRFLAHKHPDIKGRETGDGLVKLSAGQLIEKAGLKGKILGKAGVSKKHALVLVSYGGAKSGEVVNLYKKIQKSVKSKFNIHLEPEVKIVS